jgi:hypothetical protein
MTRTEIVKMSENAGIMPPGWGATENQWRALRVFAELAVKHQQETYAKLCEETAQRLFEEGKQYEAHGADICADMIRAHDSKEKT